MQTTLNKLKKDQQGVVVSVSGDAKVKRRLFDMGITPGAGVLLKKVAPLGDPIEITVRSYELSLRKDEAANVVVEV